MVHLTTVSEEREGSHERKSLKIDLASGGPLNWASIRIKRSQKSPKT
jgi:hypothetical protein